MLPANCPRCESEQAFVPKLRETQHGWQEVYIRCPICRYECVLRQTTPEIETISKQLDRYAKMEQAIINDGRQPTSTMESRKRKLRQEHAKLVSQLAKEVRDGAAGADAHAHTA